ncbi:MAG: hypothetical protein WAU88_05670 [Candidatus Zixiibacteriota bacterium]
MNRSVLYWGAVALLFALAIFVRTYDLNADPPAFFALGSQDLTTDGSYLTLHAKQGVLYGQWDLFDYRTWTPFKISLVSGASYLAFSVLGVSRTTANLAGAFLSLAGLLVTLLALWDSRKRRFSLLLAFFLCTSFMLTVYGRVPFSENGLFFLASLALFAFQKWYHLDWGKLLVGLLIALCGLLGKSFGFLLLAGPLVCIVGSDRNKVRSLALVLAPFAVTFAAFWLLYYSDQGFFTFLWEHSAGVHGFPRGLKSPKGFLESMISFGRYGFFAQAAIVGLLAYLALGSRLIGSTGSSGNQNTNLYMICWILATVIPLAPFNYLPLRYLHLLFIPMSVIAAQFLSELEGTGIGKFKIFRWWKLLLLLLLNWCLVYYIWLGIAKESHVEQFYFDTVWYSFPLAFILTAIMVLGLKNRTLRVPNGWSRWLVAGIVVAIVAIEGYRHIELFTRSQYTLAYANDDVASLVGPDAVIAGQYGPAITEDSRIRSFPLFVTDNFDEMSKLFRQYPITHFAISESSWKTLVKKLPMFAQVAPVTRFWVRDNVVVLARIAELFGNGEAARYRPSDYERAIVEATRQRTDSTEFYLFRFLDQHPTSRAGLCTAYYLTLGSGPLNLQQPKIDRLLASYPTDFAATALAAIYYKRLFEQTHQVLDRERGEELLQRAIELNPANAENLRLMYSSYPVEQRIL